MKPSPIQTRTRANARRVVLTFALMSSMLVAILFTPTASFANTPSAVADITLPLSFAGSGQMNAYSNFLVQLRQAVGNQYRDSVGQTQTEDSGIVRVSMTDGFGGIYLYIEPRNLYLRGFSTWGNGNQNLYEFNDNEFNLRSRLEALGILPSGFVHGLGFSSNYNSLVQTADRGRENMPISWGDLIGSWTNLANATPTGNEMFYARSLMFMIQLTSEAARFTDVEGVMRAITVNGGTRYAGLPMLQQRLENEWTAIGNFGYQVSQNPSASPLTILINSSSTMTFSSWQQVQQRLSILNTLGARTDSGDWRFSEL